jgi:hypothetical protein
VSVNLGWIENYKDYHRAELLREAEMERLAQLATGPARPLRARLAERLYAVAEWVEGTQHQPAMGAEAR